MLQELDFATLANAICTCKELSEEADLLWQITCLRVHPDARKVEGFNWRWVALSKREIEVCVLFSRWVVIVGFFPQTMNYYFTGC